MEALERCGYASGAFMGGNGARDEQNNGNT